MATSITGRHYEVTAIRALVTKKLDRIVEKLFADVIDVRVVLQAEKYRNICEILITGKEHDVQTTRQQPRADCARNLISGNRAIINEYTYTYPAALLPAAYGKPLTVRIEVDPGKDQDRFSSLGADREMDKLYEMAAQARLAAVAQPEP